MSRYFTFSVMIILFFGWSKWSRSQEIVTPTCNINTLDEMNIEPDAQFKIGVLLNAHEVGDGLYGCGQASDSGIQAYEALRVAISMVNRRPMNTDHFSMSKALNGVKIGLKILDCCGHLRKTEEQITKLYPFLKAIGSSSEKCLEEIDNKTSLVLGAIDLTGATNSEDLKRVLNESSIPVLYAPSDYTSSLAPDHVARILLEVSYSMEWNRFAIIYEGDLFSRSVLKTIEEISLKGHICVTVKKEISKSTKDPKRAEELRQIVKSVSAGLAEGVAVIVIAQGTFLSNLLIAMRDEPEATIQNQWLFSGVPDASVLATMGRNITNSRLFSLSPYPGIREEFESRWSQIGTDEYALPKFLWHAELAAKKLSNCYNNQDKTACLHNGSIVPDNPVHALQRTSVWLTMIDAVEEFVTSLREAWYDACGDGSPPAQPGPCPKLLSTTRKMFKDKYFKPSRFANRETGLVSDAKLALTQYLFDERIGLHFNQIAVYEETGSDIKDSKFQYMPSKCVTDNCALCTKTAPLGRSLENHPVENKPSITTIAFSGDLLIPILLPLHKQGDSPLECGTELNADAVQDLEAALWIIDKINQDSSFLRGIQLGVQIIDTCSSSSQLAHKLSRLLSEYLPFASAPSFVSSLDPASSSVAAALLHPLNITYVSAQDVTYGPIGHTNENSPYILRVTTNPKTKAKAIIDVLKKMKWDFVSLVYGPESNFQMEVEAIRDSLKKASICLAVEEHLSTANVQEANKILNSLIDAKGRGGRAVILVTDSAATRQLFSLAEDYLLSGKMTTGDFTWLAAGGWTNNLAVVQGLESTAQGSLLFSPAQINVGDFVSHFRFLNPENNRRNPFFNEYWRQSLKCVNEACEGSVRYKPSKTVGHIMQAILSVAAGLARSRNELCSTDTLGLCPRFVMEPQIRQVFNHYIRFTRAIHPDGKGGMFSFSTDGYGDNDVDIFNFRKISGGSYVYQKVGSYKRQLTNLLPVVGYDNHGKETSLEKLTSTCLSYCAHCSKKSDDFLIIPSSNDLYLTAVFNIREPDPVNPLKCKKNISPKGIRQLEAFIWALHQANTNILGNALQLGAVVIDSCSSRGKTAKDVSNFFSNTLSNDQIGEIPPSIVDGTLCFVTTAASRDIVQPLISLSVPLKIPTISLSPVDFNLPALAPLSLSYAMRDDSVCDCILALIKNFKWVYVSVVSSREGSRSTVIYKKLRKILDSNSIQVALHEEVVNDKNLPNEVYENIIYGLRKKKMLGAKVVLLLTSLEETMSIFSASQQLQKRGKFQPSDFLFVGLDNVEAFQKFPDQVLGGLVIRTKAHTETPFTQYFARLSKQNSTKNTWFKEFVEQQKELGQLSSVQDAGRQADPVVSNAIQSVLSIATAVSFLYKTDCNGKSEGCLRPNTLEDRVAMRERLFNKTKDVVLVRPDGLEVSFGDKRYIDGSLEILNFRQLGSHSLAFLSVGTFSETRGILLNTSHARGYDSRGNEFSLSNFQSKCSSAKDCSIQPNIVFPNVMYINRNAKLLLGALMTVHKEGPNIFTCGSINNPEIFENVVALSYAIEIVNKNQSLLRDVNLGAVIFDYCDQEQRAEQQLYSFFAEKAALEANPDDSQTIVTLMTFGDSITNKVSPILEVKKIPVIINPGGRARTKRAVPVENSSVRSMSAEKGQADAIVEMLKQFDWRYVFVVDVTSEISSDTAAHLVKRAKERGICIATNLKLNPIQSIQEIGNRLKEALTDPQPRVVVLLTDDSFSTNLVLKAAKETHLLSRFVWIGSEGWATDREAADILDGSNVDAFTIAMESPVLSGIGNYFANLTLTKHEPIPDSWFEEYWQDNFRCRLVDARYIRKQYPDICTGTEKLTKGSLVEKRVKPIFDAVYAVANSLDGQVRKLCSASMTNSCYSSLDSSSLISDIKIRLTGAQSDYVYNIYHLGNRSDGVYSYEKVGTWNEGQSDVKLNDINFPRGPPLSLCIGTCSSCLSQMSNADVFISVQTPKTLYDNFQTVWGITTTSLSVLGIALVVICGVYFLMAFPYTVGTTVLGYKILFGLFLLYAVNLAFILSPTESTCGVRRFVLGLAYSVIFSGMLIKVANTWRLMGDNGNRMMNDATRMSSPAGLLVVSVGLVVVQIILTAAWLVLIPPKTGFYRGMWRCSPPNTFEDELIISLVYVMLILAVTIFFSVLTWKCRENGQESRWILACCVFVTIVWVAWTVLSTHLSLQYRDVTIVIANLLCATLVMLCLYMRKVYVYSKLTRQLKSRDLKVQLKGSLPYQHSLYGTLQNNLSSVAPVLCGSQASLTTKSFYGGGFGHVQLDEVQSEGGASTSSGSVQVQGTDLYPLEMYDGGSHLSLYGPKSMLGVGDGTQ